MFFLLASSILKQDKIPLLAMEQHTVSDHPSSPGCLAPSCPDMDQTGQPTVETTHYSCFDEWDILHAFSADPRYYETPPVDNVLCPTSLMLDTYTRANELHTSIGQPSILGLTPFLSGEQFGDLEVTGPHQMPQRLSDINGIASGTSGGLNQALVGVSASDGTALMETTTVWSET